MTLLRSWVLGLTAAALISSAAEILTPEGSVKNVVRFVSGLVLAAMLLSPFLQADRTVFSRAITEYRKTTEALTGELEDREKQLLRTYIQDQCAAYILDEADRLGCIGLRVSVRMKWRDESWVPYEAAIEGKPDPAQRSRLSAWIDAELGIPAERQTWREE